MRLWKIAFLFLACSLLLTSCGSEQSQPADLPDLQQQLTIYTSHKEEVYLPIIREFEERTGIWVNVVYGGTNELLEQIAEESSTPEADVFFGGSIENLESYRDYFSPYTCTDADQIQSQYRSEDSILTPFSALPIVLIYNTKLVNKSQLTSWADLLDPAFQGRIAFADPAVSGSSFTGLVTFLYASGLEFDEATVKFSQALNGNILTSSIDILTNVADGTCLVGITLEETALKYIAAGEDIAIVYPADGTSCIPDGSALVKGAPHEENAKLFLDFTVSYDVQQLLADSFFRRPVRSDVTGGTQLTSLSDIPLVDYDVAWAALNRDAVLSDWAFLLKEES